MHQWLSDVCSTQLINNGLVRLSKLMRLYSDINRRYLILLHVVSSWKTSPAARVFGLVHVDTSHPPCQKVYGCQCPHLLHKDPYIALLTSGQLMLKQLLQSLSFVQHSTVNNTLDFVNPTTGTHTQLVVSCCGRVKNIFKSYSNQ